MKSEAVAKHRAAILRPLLELEKKGGPIGRAIGDAAWELGLSKSYTWKLYRRLKENDARSVALQPGRRGPKPGKGRGVPPLKWSTNWDNIIPFQEDQRWLERETNPKRSC